MPNHFHLLLKIRNEEQLKSYFGSKMQSDNLADIISKQFSNFFNAYVKAFNKMHKRKGSLLMHTFKRIEVTDNDYLVQLVKYINLNPVEAGLCAEPCDWKYSSYNELISENETFIKREKVISLFEDVTGFRKGFELG